MIKGVHTMFYSSEAEALRAFIRDKLGFSYTDVGEGWLIFNKGASATQLSESAEECYQDLLWALVNSKQFLFVR